MIISISNLSPNEILTILQTIHGESRGEPFIGQLAVASVILNRVCMDNESFGKNVIEVCKKNNKNGIYQFSCWNPIDVNYRIIHSLTENALEKYYPIIDILEYHFPKFLPLNVCYYQSVKNKPSRFFDGLKYYTTIGNHRFYY